MITPASFPVIKMIPDAEYIDVSGEVTGIPGKLVIEDTKGMVTDTFKLKVKLFHGMYPAIGIFMVKGRYRKKAIAFWEVTDIIPVKTRVKRIITQPNV